MSAIAKKPSLAEPVLRVARASDLATVVALVQACGLPPAGISDAFPDSYAVVCVGSEIVAAAGLEVHGDFGLLRSVAVQPLHRRSGLGRTLVTDRLQFGKLLPLQAVYLLTTNAPDYFRRLGSARHSL
ncbi:MAG: hypothetical protein RL701_5100 [Pseudomonadota bacterium]